ncbi:AbrB/MazE/SpoVT family DNA-binding domain-containing protein [Eggerthellaceae bacterium 24-137]
MATATLTKVGNSMAVLLPKALRQEACISQDTPLRIASPRKGVVVITSVLDDRGDRLARLEEFERQNKERELRARSWPEGGTAEDLIAEAKEARYRDFLAL